jgi:ParB-like chromosome segregation protein Spo0J
MKKDWFGTNELGELLVDINSVNLDERNARGHKDLDINAVAQSLKQFGQIKPIVSYNGVIIAGNGTLQAARRIGWTQIAVVKADYLTETEARAYALADNRTAELSFWDKNILPYELEQLKALDFEINSLGWSDKDLEKILDATIEETDNVSEHERTSKTAAEDKSTTCPACGHLFNVEE